MGKGKAKGNCQDLGEGRGERGTGVSKSFRFDLFLLTGQPVGSTRAEMMKKVEVKKAGAVSDGSFMHSFIHFSERVERLKRYTLFHLVYLEKAS